MFQSDTLSITVYIKNKANFESMHFVQISKAIFLEFWNISKHSSCTSDKFRVCSSYTFYKFQIHYSLNFYRFQVIFPAVFTNFECITPWVFTNFESVLNALLTNLVCIIYLVFTSLDTVKIQITHYSVPGHGDVLPRRRVPTTRTNKLPLSSRQNIRKRSQDCTRSNTVPYQKAIVSIAGAVRNTDIRLGGLVLLHRVVW